MGDISDLVIELVSGDGTARDAFRIGSENLLAHAEEGYGFIMRRAAGSAADGQEVLHLTYADDEGDMCTLSGSTIKDALTFVRIDETAGVKILTLVVATAAKGTCDNEDSSPTPTEDSEGLEVAAMEALNRLGSTMDLRKLIPKLASTGLRLCEEFQEPAFFEVLDIMMALKEGVADVERIPALLPQLASTFAQVPADVQRKVLKRLGEEAQKAVQELHDEESSTKRCFVEVHRNIICDGCEMNPIIGPRYKSLAVDDFDLCQTCYQKEDRAANQWCQVASPVVGEVVSSFFADAGQPATDVHHCVQCDGCGMHPIVGKRFNSLQRFDYDLCEDCYTKHMDDPETRDHRFEEKPLPDRLVVHGDVARTVEREEANHRVEQDENLSQPAMEEGPPKVDMSEEVDATMEKARAALEESSTSATQDALRRLLANPSAEVRAATAAAVLAAAQDDSATPSTPTPSIEPDFSSTCSADEDWNIPANPSAAADPAPSETPASPPRAKVLDSMPLVTGIEAQEVEGARGDVTQEFAGRILAASQVYRVGAITMPTCSSVPVPACATAVVQNSGEVPWPEGAVVAAVLGHDLGMPSLDLGPVKPGEAAEIILDLLVPPRDQPGTICSAWAMLDSATGEHLGPTLVFETRWTL